jgi:hypothetical protein
LVHYCKSFTDYPPNKPWGARALAFGKRSFLERELGKLLGELAGEFAGALPGEFFLQRLRWATSSCGPKKSTKIGCAGGAAAGKIVQLQSP